MLKRSIRTEILIQSNSSLANELAEEIITNYPHKEINAPHYGLTMLKLRESAQNSLFHIGEVLVTECKVEIAGHIGVGIVVGMENDLAKHLAIIDAAYGANLPETIHWAQKLQHAEQKIKEEKAKKQAELLQTKVNFETMEE
ncbi:phosphonate C-P lyase system protein PhnG [Pseudogracilibacillus sp. SO30301A]|uniref:phosphonate C-P lyase system protein PhnG n=1 Tax=Pseudogracilibacillus sp. SO30301A TaxID=3098291 RepID=UPI00300DD9AC